VKPRALVALLVLLALATLSPLALASPVDPTWVAGFWDDGDHDDVVLLVCAAVADLATPPAPPDATAEVVASIQLVEPAKRPLRPVASALSRAPPRA